MVFGDERNEPYERNERNELARTSLQHANFKMATMYVLCWRNAAGNVCKSKCMTYDLAQAWLEFEKTEFPDIEHWIEEG